MKIISKIQSAEATEGNWTEPRGIVSAVQDEPVRGFFRQVQLGCAGLTIKHGKAIVGIPLAELIALAESVEPALLPPAPTEAGATKDLKKPNSDLG